MAAIKVGAFVRNTTKSYFFVIKMWREGVTSALCVRVRRVCSTRSDYNYHYYNIVLYVITIQYDDDDDDDDYNSAKYNTNTGG